MWAMGSVVKLRVLSLKIVAPALSETFSGLGDAGAKV
jgi:hypothetical protein